MFTQNLSFHNWSKDDFTCSWANTPYTFKSGRTYSVPSDAGVHFAKHLAQLELNKAGQETFTIDPPSPNFKEFYNRALPSLAIQQPFEEISFEEVSDPNSPLKEATVVEEEEEESEEVKVPTVVKQSAPKKAAKAVAKVVKPKKPSDAAYLKENA